MEKDEVANTQRHAEEVEPAPEAAGPAKAKKNAKAAAPKAASPEGARQVCGHDHRLVIATNRGAVLQSCRTLSCYLACSRVVACFWAFTATVAASRAF